MNTLTTPLSTSMSVFASTVYSNKYAQTGETWQDSGPGSLSTARRVVENVMKPYFPELVEEMIGYISDRKFMPGGRYLYASGKRFHQVNNCFSGDTRVVTRDGTKSLQSLAGTSPTLMTTGGEWVTGEVKSFGVQPLRKVTLRRAGREKVIYATGGHSWRVASSENSKTGRPTNKQEVITDELRSGQRLWDEFGYGISRTPLSPAGIQHGVVFGDGTLPDDEHGFNTARVRLCGAKDAQLLKHFSDYPSRVVESDTEVTGLPRRYKSAPSLQEDRSYLLGWLAGYLAADGNVTSDGSTLISSTDRNNLQLVRDVCYLLGIGTYEIRSQDRISNLTNRASTIYSVRLMRHTLTEDLFLLSEHRIRFAGRKDADHRPRWNVVSVEATNRVEPVFCAVVPDTHEFVLEDNILTGNCLLLDVEDSREGWADLMQRVTNGLMTGAGIGIVYSKLRGRGEPVKGMGGTSTGPTALMQMVNETARHIMQGGSRRAAIWAGLHWNHPDVMEFIALKDWSDDIKAMKEKDFNFPATLDGTNISVILDDEFFAAYENSQDPLHNLAHRVYWTVVGKMLTTGEPGFSVDTGANAGEHLRNACTELTSRDNNDVCNLGSINLARVTDLDEMARLTFVATAFLLCGTLYSKVPYEEIAITRNKNRRLGLGLMGIYEWLAVRGKPYAPDDELAVWLDEYAESGVYADLLADRLGVSRPVKTRAIAPTGTIGILAETTTGIEPVFAKAIKRRYLKGDIWHFQYVIDASVQRLVERGVDPDLLEDAYDLAKDPGRRLGFQAWVQQWVDHGISSTLNLPAKEDQSFSTSEFGDILMQHLPNLRGVTVYPDGARGGQPLTKVPYQEALDWEGREYEEVGNSNACVSGSCGV